jgi:hypothetical protein
MIKSKSLSIFLFLILIFTLTSGCSRKKKAPVGERHIPNGWYISNSNVKVRYKKLKASDPAYKLDFERSWKDEEEKYYLLLAESLYPERELIEKARKDLPEKVQTDPSWYFERIWSGYLHEGKKIPYSLTSGTIQEYLDYYKTFRKKIDAKREGLDLVGDNRDRIDFAYKANVTKSGSGYKVEMYFRWYQYCGLPCGWGFEKTRTVTFQNRGYISSIEGDGLPELWISSDEDPYGREWFTF